jgi:hypothetical protein
MLALTSVAQAQATRTWVSGVGDDVNPCSRTAPCKTFAGAISKTFIGGEIDALDPGGFGTVTITKSMTIDGGATLASILASGTNGVNVNILVNANDPNRRVTLRRLTINGAGASGAIGTSTGIRGVNASTNGFSQLYVENTYIQNFTTVGIDVNFAAAATGARISFKDTNITNTGVGIQLNTSANFISGVIDNVRVESMSTGINLKERANAAIRNSVVQNCSTAGVALNSGPSNQSFASLESTYILSATTGVVGGAAGTLVDLSNTTIAGNSTGITTGGGTIQSHGNNQIFNNSVPGTTPTGIGQQ